MLSRYRFNRATTDALLAADPELDVFEATALGYIDRLRERLMADPASAAAFSPDGFTALHYAGFFGKVEAARELIAAGASVDVYTKNPFANQPLHAAAAGRHLEVCRLLLGAGADVNATQHGGYTPLHEAAQSGDVELAELFLSAGADPTVRERRRRDAGRDRRGRRPPRPGGTDPGGRRGPLTRGREARRPDLGSAASGSPGRPRAPRPRPSDRSGA